jgi:hypothetical protein
MREGLCVASQEDYEWGMYCLSAYRKVHDQKAYAQQRLA